MFCDWMVNAGLAESNGSLPPGLWLLLTTLDRDQLRNHTLVLSMGLRMCICAGRSDVQRRSSADVSGTVGRRRCGRCADTDRDAVRQRNGDATKLGAIDAWRNYFFTVPHVSSIVPASVHISYACRFNF